MTIIQTVTKSDFLDAFQAHGRADQFSREALEAMYGWLEEYSDDTGEPVELDVIALCCEWSEYESAAEAAEQYGWEPDEGDDDDDREASALDYLNEHTTVLGLSGGVLMIDY